MPKALLIAAAALFAASVSAALVGAGVYFWHDTDFWEHFEPAPVLRVTAAVLFGLTVSSGLLFVHFRAKETYVTFEEILFGFRLFVSAVNLLWVAPVLFFL